ncbi:hypothetical protein LFM09_20275 [Lentzea alba]|uniref:hypothetical protein n=1 Tax=Lentzea alba TaxID=2714351 RepID=UPI0039BFA508
MPRKRKVFIVWMHEPRTRALVAVLEQLLKQAGFDVERDSAFKTSNLPSLAQRMANNIENRVVICVVTPGLARWFNASADAPVGKHLGIQWEIRQMIQRMYEHGSRPGCPVIPVLPPGVVAEDGPMILRGLENTSFNPITGEGINIIVERVKNANAHSEPELKERRSAEDRTLASTQPWDGLSTSIRNVDPSLQHAHELSESWIKRARKKGVTHSSAMLPVYRKIRMAALYAGDLVLLEQATDICVQAVDQLDLDDEIRVEKCTYLLNRAFLLFCAHEVNVAQTVAEKALALAHDAKNTTLIAMARRCLAFIHVHLAEFNSAVARAEEVQRARAYATSAMNHFEFDNEDKHLAVLAMAQVHLAEHRHERNKRSLDEAERLSAEAAKGFPDQRLNWYYEARLLQVKVAFELRKADTATELLNETLRDLRSRAEQSEAYLELLGEGHLLRARIRVSLRRADAQVEIGEARAIFDKLGLQRMVDVCDWLSFSCELKRHRFSAYDIRALERVCPDPGLRLRVARRGRTWSVFWEFPGRIGDKNWKRAVEETQAGEG